MGFTPTVPTGSPFTFDNVPFGVISTGNNTRPRCAVAIGDHALDLEKCFKHIALDSLGNLDLVQVFGKVSHE